MSQGLFLRGEYDDVQHYVRSKGYYGSGDSTITETIQVLLGILPTDPGRRMFPQTIGLWTITETIQVLLGILPTDPGGRMSPQTIGLWTITETIQVLLGILPTDPGWRMSSQKIEM